MSIEKLIQDLEDNYKKGFNERNTLKKCILIINEIFQKIKNDNEFYNLFIDELHHNFIIYFKNLAQDLSNKELLIDHNKDELIKQKYSKTTLNDELLKKINKLIAKELKILQIRETENKVTRPELTISGGLKIFRIIRLLNKEFSQNGHLNSISNYLGYKSEINGLAIELSSEKSTWWKHKKDTKEPKTLAVHLDKEFSSIKSIVYLTDVDENNGPFTVYPDIYENLNLNLFQNILGRIIDETSLNVKNQRLNNFLNINDKDQPLLSKNFKEIYNMLPINIAFNSTFGWDIKHGSIEEEKIINVKNQICGKAGTIITFDGSKLLHSGGLVKKGSRIVFQIIYSKKINIFYFLFKKILKKII